jgi:hypothetical protein
MADGGMMADGGEIGQELMGGQPNQEKPSGAILLEVRKKGKEIVVTEDDGETKELYVKSNGFSGYTLHYKGNQYEFAHSLDSYKGGQMADGGVMAKGGEISDINKMKKSLIAKAKSKGIYEDFGQKEVRQLEDKYGYTAAIKNFDNWAMNFDLSQMADGGVMAKGGKVWHKRVGNKDFYFDKNAIWYQEYGTYKLGEDGKEYSVNERINKVYKSKSGLDEIKMYRKNKDYRVIDERKDSKGNLYYIAFLDVSDKMNNTISFAIGDLYAKGGNVTYKHGGQPEGMRYEGSTMYEDMQEAKQYMGEDKWNKMTRFEKINTAKYLKAKGLIGMYGQEEDLETLAAMAYKRGGRS